MDTKKTPAADTVSSSLGALARKKELWVILAVLIFLLLLSYVRVGFQDGSYFEIGRAPILDSKESSDGIRYTHYVSSVCESAKAGTRGINFRTERLSTAELKEVERDTTTSNRTLISWLDNGQKVIHLGREGKWHHIVTVLEGDIFIGFISASCRSELTIVPVRSR